MISNLDYNQGRPDQCQSRRPADEKTVARKADMVAQAAWLLERAIAEGYRSLDELVRVNCDRFAALGSEWRQAHPVRY
jgi:hypothetical protein